MSTPPTIQTLIDDFKSASLLIYTALTSLDSSTSNQAYAAISALKSTNASLMNSYPAQDASAYQKIFQNILNTYEYLLFVVCIDFSGIDFRKSSISVKPYTTGNAMADLGVASYYLNMALSGDVANNMNGIYNASFTYLNKTNTLSQTAYNSCLFALESLSSLEGAIAISAPTPPLQSLGSSLAVSIATNLSNAFLTLANQANTTTPLKGKK